MKRLTILFLLAFTFICVLLPACEGLDDNYSTNPNHRLSFSVDTLSFDTVFTTIGSATRQFMIYNENNDALNIETILLADGQNTGFRMNVDGRKGDRFDNMLIMAKDSMYVFVEVTVNPKDADKPLLIQDSVVFSVNGIQQSVLLEAYGQDVHLYKGGITFDEDITLSAQRPYLIYDNVTIAKDATVTIEKGATIYMHNKAQWIVSGSLVSNGTEDEPVVFRGDRLDFIIDDVFAYDRSPGQWGGITFKPESYNNILNYTIIRNGTTGINCLPASTEQSKLKIQNSQITNMDGNLLMAVNCDIEVTNSELSNATDTLAGLHGGNYRFIHSTLANHMTIKSRKSSSSLTLANLKKYADDTQVEGSINASFTNCIIDGNNSAGSKPWEGEINLDDAETQDFSYSFNYCVIKTKGENTGNNTDNIFITRSPLFRALGGRDNKYRYDFRPDSATTVGVGKADPAVTAEYPKDRYGINRLTSEHGPTIGAYEFTPEEKDE